MRLWATRDQNKDGTKNEYIYLWKDKPVDEGPTNYCRHIWLKNAKSTCSISVPAIPIGIFKKEAGRLPGVSSPMLVNVRIRPVKKPGNPQAKKA